MQYNRSEAIGKLLDSWRTYYNVSLCKKEELPLRAVCEYYEQNEKYVISRKANLWTARSEEFIFLYEVSQLTADILKDCLEEARKRGMALAHIGSGHMYTYITPVFICDTCDPSALKLLKKYNVRKSFLFSFHGWMEMHPAVFEAATQAINSNKAGKCVEKVLKKVLSN